MIVCLGSVQSSPALLIHSSLAATVRWENKYVGNNSNGGNGWWFEYWIFRERVGTRGTCGGIWLNIVEYFSQNKIFFGRIFLSFFGALDASRWLSSNSGTIMTRRPFTQRSTICETSTDGAPSSPRQKHLSRLWLTARYLWSPWLAPLTDMGSK